jgi:hypothetical protein
MKRRLNEEFKDGIPKSTGTPQEMKTAEQK